MSAVQFTLLRGDFLPSEKLRPWNKTDERYERLDLEVYSDEILEVVDPRDGTKWIYIGILFIPLDKKETCLKILKNHRCIKHGDWSDNKHECLHPCEYHENNNTEVHYKEVHRSDARFKIACKWIKFISSDACAKGNKMIFFNILGINLTNLNLDRFGSDSDRVLTIYNRFYRTALLGGLKYFFKKYKTIIIHKIYHDEGSQKNHKYCPWHSIYKINIQTENIFVLVDEIEFINSDHRVSSKDESQFIQLVDILLGAVYSCLHNNSKKHQKKKLGYLFKPTLETLLDRRKHECSDRKVGRYYQSNYFRTYQVSFFPSKGGDDQEFQQMFDLDYPSKGEFPENYYYYDRPVVVKDPEQLDLSKWIPS
jgi:hypothetical protein